MDSTYSNTAAEDRTKALQSPDHDGETTRPHHSSTSTPLASTTSDNVSMRLYHPSYVTNPNTYSQPNLPSIHRSTSTRSKEQSPVQSAARAAAQPTGVIMGPAGLPLASTTKDMITGTTPTQRPSRAKKGKRVHDCTHPGCGKIFTRAEHLRRHQLNHSTEVVYKCEICDKKFVRQDLLSRHQERHATSTMKAVPQSYRGHPHQYGPIGYPMTAPGEQILPLPSSEYGPHSYDPSGFRGVLPQNVDPTASFPHYSNTSSPHQSSVISSPVASATSLQATYPAPSHPSDSHLDFSNIARTPSPASSRRSYGSLPYHVPRKDVRRHDSYIVSQSEMQRGIPVSVAGPSTYQSIQPIQPSSIETYGWLLDEQQSGKGLGIQMNHLAPMPERSRISNSYSPPPTVPDCTPSNPTMENRGFFQFQHPIDEKARNNVLGIINNPTFANRDVGSMPAMQGYLASYWKSFHSTFPILHRPTFVPSEQLSCLIAMVVAVGASYSEDQGARNLAMTIYERVRDYVLTGEFQSLLPSNLQFQQTLLLTDIFGKLRTSQQTFSSDVRIDSILADCVRRIDPSTPRPRSILHGFQELGLPLDLETEWRRWVEVESSRKLATFYLLWDVQQGVMFEKPLAWHSHKLETATPSKAEENLWNCETALEWQKYLQEVPVQHSLLSLLQDCLNPEPLAPIRQMSPYEVTFVLHGLTRTDISRMNSSDGDAKKDRMSHAILKWRQYYSTYTDGTLGAPCAERIEGVYTLTQIMRNTNICVLRNVAGDPRKFYSNPSSCHVKDFYLAKQELQNWAGSMDGRISTWHAVRFLNRILSQGTVGCYDRSITPWTLYICALVCWAYGTFPGRSGYASDGKAMWEPESSARDYLNCMMSQSWNTLPTVQIPPVDGLLFMVQQLLARGTWGVVLCSSGILGALLQGTN